MNAGTKLSAISSSPFLERPKKPTSSSKISRLEIQQNFPATRQAKALETRVSGSFKGEVSSPYNV